jgi:hypothetical protein
LIGNYFRNEKINFVVLVFCLVAVIFTLYFHALNFGFTNLDDNNSLHLVSNELAKKTAFIDVFKKDVMLGKSPTPYYRPIVALSFVFDYKIAGESEWYAHFSCITLHCITTILIFLFLKRYLFKSVIPSFLAALIFAVHPSCLYTVIWVTGRNESLLLMNFLISLMFFIEYVNRERVCVGGGGFIFLIAHMFFILLCFFTKESGIVFPFITLLYFFLTKEKTQKLKIYVYFVWAILILFFMISRKLVVGVGGFSIPFCKDGLVMFFDYYSSMFFLKTPVGVADMTLELFVLGLSGFLLSLFFAFYNVKDTKIIKKNVFFLLITLISISTNYINGTRLWFQGNRMYVPMLGVIVLFISFLTPYLENKKTRNWIIYCSVIILFICIQINTKASYKFKNSIAFFGNIINESSYTNVTAIKFYGYCLMQNGRFQEAINELLPLANSLKFNYDEVNYALGSAFILNKDYINAAQIFETMIQKRQMLIPQVYANLILAMHFSNNIDKANYYFSEFMRTANLDLDSANTYLNNFNNFVDIQRKTNLQRPKTV